jgi:hypothetical protein
MPFSRKNIPFNTPADELVSQSTQHPVCTWSAHPPQSGSSPSPLPRYSHTLTETANSASELYLFGGFANKSRSSDVYVFSTRDFSTTLLQTSGEVPDPGYAHSAALTGTTLLITCGYGKDDSLYLLNLGTSDRLMSIPTCQLIIPLLRSRIESVVPRCGQWTRAGRSFLPYYERGRFQALHLWWNSCWEEHE